MSTSLRALQVSRTLLAIIPLAISHLMMASLHAAPAATPLPAPVSVSVAPGASFKECAECPVRTVATKGPCGR